MSHGYELYSVRNIVNNVIFLYSDRWKNIFGVFFKNLFYLFLAALGLCCCARAFSSCSKWGLLTEVASLVAEHEALGAWASVVLARGF